MPPLLPPPLHTSDGDEDVSVSSGDCFVPVADPTICSQGSPTSAGTVFSSCREEVGQLCCVSRCCVEVGVWNSGEYRGRTLSRDGRDPELRTQFRDSQRSVCLGGSTRGVGDDPWFIGGWPLGGYITVPFQLFWRRGFSVLRALKCSENEEQSELCDLLCCGAVEDSVYSCVPVCNSVPGVVMGLIRLCCVQPVWGNPDGVRGCAISSQSAERIGLCPDEVYTERGGCVSQSSGCIYDRMTVYVLDSVRWTWVSVLIWIAAFILWG